MSTPAPQSKPFLGPSQHQLPESWKKQLQEMVNKDPASFRNLVGEDNPILLLPARKSASRSNFTMNLFESRIIHQLLNSFSDSLLVMGSHVREKIRVDEAHRDNPYSRVVYFDHIDRPEDIDFLLVERTSDQKLPLGNRHLEYTESLDSSYRLISSKKAYEDKVNEIYSFMKENYSNSIFRLTKQIDRNVDEEDEEKDEVPYSGFWVTTIKLKFLNLNVKIQLVAPSDDPNQRKYAYDSLANVFVSNSSQFFVNTLLNPSLKNWAHREKVINMISMNCVPMEESELDKKISGRMLYRFTKMICAGWCVVVVDQDLNPTGWYCFLNEQYRVLCYHTRLSYVVNDLPMYGNWFTVLQKLREYLEYDDSTEPFPDSFMDEFKKILNLTASQNKP